MPDAAEGLELIFDRPGDLVGHTLGASAGVGDDDRDGGQVDVGGQIERQGGVGQGADDEPQQHEHEDEDRLADGGVGDRIAAQFWFGWCGHSLLFQLCIDSGSNELYNACSITTSTIKHNQ